MVKITTGQNIHLLYADLLDYLKKVSLPPAQQGAQLSLEGPPGRRAGPSRPGDLAKDRALEFPLRHSGNESD